MFNVDRLSNNFNSFLFSKNILVNQDVSKDSFFARVTLASFGIRIIKGQEFAHEKLIPFVASMIGKNLPAPFYQNFPFSVRELTTDQLLFDQLFHYFVSNVVGNSDKDAHSVFEDDFERLPFKEKVEPKNFVIVSEEEAVSILGEYVEDMLNSTRPLNDTQYDIVRSYISEYKYEIQNCQCKDTAIRLLLDTENFYFARFLTLSDVIKFVDTLNYQKYNNKNIKNLNLKNKDRKLIANVINCVFEKGTVNVRDCFEKKAVWCGLLHHIHFQSRIPEAQKFASLMRGKGNQSVYSEFEHAMLEADIKKAVTCLREGKGSGALLRNLNYILSRCKTEDEVNFVVSKLETKNSIVLVQLLLQYANYVAEGARAFKFTRYNQLKVHVETEEETQKRGTILEDKTVRMLSEVLHKNLQKNLAGHLGKVFIDPDMYNIAVPIQENTSSGGFGVLPKGSRIQIGEAEKIRAFTYWEKVNDIDLSFIGLGGNGELSEFSWRTMYYKQSNEVTFSGDQTRGYNGGSEFFDVDVHAFKKAYPNIRYLVFCNNVFSNSTFDKCYCKAGYMIRDIEDSGEIFEPATVKSSFLIDCESTFAYLFGIDMETNEFVWLNVARNSNAHVAGATGLFEFLIPYFQITSVLNVGSLFEMMATEVVTDPKDADVIVSDEPIEVEKEVQVVRSCDFEKVAAYLNS